MTYQDVYEVISSCANDILPLFADGWERFPSEANASKIVARLENEKAFWQDRRQEKSLQIQKAIDEIKKRLTDSVFGRGKDCSQY